MIANNCSSLSSENLKRIITHTTYELFNKARKGTFPYFIRRRLVTIWWQPSSSQLPQLPWMSRSKLVGEPDQPSRVLNNWCHNLLPCLLHWAPPPPFSTQLSCPILDPPMICYIFETWNWSTNDLHLNLEFTLAIFLSCQSRKTCHLDGKEVTIHHWIWLKFWGTC